MKKILYTFTFLSLLISVSAQEYNEQVTVISSYQPLLTEPFYKLNTNPQTIDTTVLKKNIQYNILSRKVLTEFDIETIKAARVAGDPLEKLTPLKIKAGFGMYTTPYAEIFAGNLRSEKFHYSGYYSHISSFGDIKIDDNTKYKHNNAHNDFRIAAGLFTNKTRHNLDVYYNHSMYHLPNDDYSIIKKEMVSNVGFVYEIQNYSIQKPLLNYDVKLNFNSNSILNNHTEYQGSGKIIIEGNPGFEDILEQSMINVDVEMDYFSLNAGNILEAHATQFKILPMIYTKIGRHIFYVGMRFNTYTDFDDTDTLVPIYTAFQPMPYLKAHLNVIPEVLEITLGMDANVTQNSQKAISKINPLLFTFRSPEDNFIYRPEVTNIDLYAQLTTSLSHNLYFDLRGSYMNKSNLMSYSNALSYFNPEYYNTGIVQVVGDLYYKLGDKFYASLSGKMNYYDQKVSYLPLFEGLLDIRYSLQEKIIAKTQVYAYSLMNKNSDMNNSEVISGAVDWSAEVEYRFNKNWGAFVRLNNLLNSRYYRWDNRPSYRFNFVIGATFTI